MRITLSRLAGTACLVFALTQPIYAQEMPQRGASKAAVEQRFGTPQKKHAPVGTPPITRWDYPDYSVYFEGNTALHSVSHGEGVIRRSKSQPAQDSTDTRVTHHGTVIELPSIEETSSGSANDEPEDVPAASTAETDDASAEEDWDGSFRFDPATGRIVPASGSGNANAEQPTEDSTSSTDAEPASTEAEVSVEEAPVSAQDSAQEDLTEATAEDEAEHHESHSADEPSHEEPALDETESSSDIEDSSEAEANESANDNHDDAEEDGGGFQMNW